MADRFISSAAGYLPLLRMDRRAAAAALRWSGLGGGGKGIRSVANWDEDSLTMSVEAARAISLTTLDHAAFASTSAFFTDRSQAGIALDALGLAPTTRASDLSGSRRAATSALLNALEGKGDNLILAGEKREAQVGSPQHLLFGDGAAAMIVSDSGAARYLGGVSFAHDFVDMYATRNRPAPYAYEERFVREVAAAEILVPTVKAVLAATGISADRLAGVAVAEPLDGTWAIAARTLGIAVRNFASDVSAQAGDLGAAHSMFAASLMFAHAKPGDLVLIAGFGSGCDAIILEVSAQMPGAASAVAMLASGEMIADYSRFLSLTGQLDLAWGMRAEFELKTQASVLQRGARDLHGFVGGRDSLGNVQFPKSTVPVNPKLGSPEKLVDVRLADEVGTIASATADRLNYTPDPPFDFGLVQFDNGARVMMEFIDRNPKGFSVGDRVVMRFRIKAQDRRRGFRTYFWKAAPLRRAQLETV